jgi:hypothetical protein
MSTSSTWLVDIPARRSAIALVQHRIAGFTLASV